jgi:hypothetical protein
MGKKTVTKKHPPKKRKPGTPMEYEKRVAVYLRQTGKKFLTPKQDRRVHQKLGHAMAPFIKDEV